MIEATGLECLAGILYVECTICGRIYSYYDHGYCPECHGLPQRIIADRDGEDDEDDEGELPTMSFKVSARSF